jgi:hypothetical protein
MTEPEPQSDFNKFDKVIKKVLSVSRAELLERDKEWKRKKAKKKRAKKPASLGLAAGRPVSG